MALLAIFKQICANLKRRLSSLKPGQDLNDTQPQPPSERECNICCEVQPDSAFPRSHHLPESCRPCLLGSGGGGGEDITAAASGQDNTTTTTATTTTTTTTTNPTQLTCNVCLARALYAQIESKHPRRIGCPVCPQIWKPGMTVYQLLGYGEQGKDWKRAYRMRLKEVSSKSKRKRAGVYEPPEDRKTLEVLVKQDSRLCPYCAGVFYRGSGCDWMRCGSCSRSFALEKAGTIAEAHRDWLRKKASKS